MKISPPKKNRKLGPAQGGLIAVLVVWFVSSLFFNLRTHGWVSWYRLSTSGREAPGLIVRVQPEVHQRCYFQSIVASIKYEGEGDGCSLSVGNAVVVKYLPTDPAFSTLSDPWKELITMVFATLIIAIFSGLITVWRMSGKRLRCRRSSSSE